MNRVRINYHFPKNKQELFLNILIGAMIRRKYKDESLYFLFFF